MQKPAPDPLQTSPPAFTPEHAVALATRLFGVSGTVSPLNSERDQNLRLDSGSESFLLKLSNPADEVSVLEMQTEAMLHVRRVDPDLPVMQPLPVRDGSYLAVEPDALGTEHVVRLFTFLPGSMLRSEVLTLQEISDFGAVVARMGVALLDFFHAAAVFPILWDLKNTPGLRPLVDSLVGTRREAVVDILDRFHSDVEPVLGDVRAQFIHNDLTLDNVLLDESHQVSGIVDFGDLTRTPLVCDLAIGLVSMMWGRNDPLDAAAATVSGYETVTSLEGAERGVLANLVEARLAALVTIAAWRVQSYPGNADYITANVDLAWDLLERVSHRDLEEVVGAGSARGDSIDASSAVAPADSPGIAEALAASLGVTLEGGMERPSKAELIKRREAVLGPALSPTTYDEPLYLVRGDGYRLFDETGRAYIDAYNNVPVVGHANAAVAGAIGRQSAMLNTNTRYLHEAVVELAERLVATMPEGLDTVMFVNSGSEANDVAWRLATTYTGSSGALVTERAYHGVTAATLAFSPEEWVGGKEPAHVATIPAPDGYRGVHRSEEPGWVGAYLADVDDALDVLAGRGLRLAAFYIDSMFTSDGIFDPPPGYLAAVVEAAHAAGGLVVGDEVQSGYGRTGFNLWSFERAGVIPDFVTLGKPMGNGHPVAAVITRREIAQCFADETDLFSTFGGNPVAARAALAVLDEVERLDLQANVTDVGAYLLAGLRDLAARHDAIGDVRGAGLMLGVELVSDRAARTSDSETANRVMNAMKDAGVLVGATGPADNVLKIRPPLVLDRPGADAIISALDAAL